MNPKSTFVQSTYLYKYIYIYSTHFSDQEYYYSFVTRTTNQTTCKTEQKYTCIKQVNTNYSCHTS